MQMRLVGYVKSGGRLVFLSPPPRRDVMQKPNTRLVDALDIGQGEKVMQEKTIRLGDKEWKIFLYQRLDLKGFEPMVKTTDSEPCVVEKKVGKGSVVLVSISATEPDLLSALIDTLAFPWQVRSNHPTVHTTLFSDAERTVIFAINRGKEPARTKITLHVPLKLKENDVIEEAFTYEKLKLERNQEIEITIPAKDVALIHIHPEAPGQKLDVEKQIRQYYQP